MSNLTPEQCTVVDYANALKAVLQGLVENELYPRATSTLRSLPEYLHLQSKQITALQAEIESLKKQLEWQPIQTTPAIKDDVLFLATTGHMKIQTGHLVRNLLHASKIDGDDCYYTHWRHLPKRPIDAAIKESGK